jgi:hypothetical protein
MSKFENTVKNLEMVKEMISQNRPIFEISRKLNVKYETLKAHLKKLGIEYKTNPNRKGIAHHEKRKTAYEYLKKDSHIKAPVLKRKLIEDGIKEYRCERCGITEWQGCPVPLELHHINEDHYDNRLENLIILCSNCHALAHNYCQKVIKFLEGEKKEKESKQKIETKSKKQNKCGIKHIHICKTCHKQFYGRVKQDYCSYECFHKSTRKSNNEITKELLLKLFKEKGSFLQVGKELKISDKAVVKWCKKLGLPTHSKEMKEYVNNMAD